MRGLLTNIQKVPSLGAGAVASRGRTQADARLADEHPEGLRILVLPIVLRGPTDPWYSSWGQHEIDAGI